MKTAFKLVAFLLLFSVYSCKKESNKPKSKLELLTQAGWKVTSLEEKIGNGPWQTDQNYATAPACEKDNILLFRTNNIVEFNEGATKCDPTDPQILFTGAWAFLENDTKLMFDSETYTIEQLTNDVLVLMVSDSYQGITYYLRINLAH